MKLLFLLIVLAPTFFAVERQSQKTKTPVEILYGERTEEERSRGPVISGIMNSKIVSIDLLEYPKKAKEAGIHGQVEVQILINEDGEVIFANPLSGPEELWASSVRAAVTACFGPFTLAGRPAKRTGRIIFNFKNSKVDVPSRTGA